MELIERTVDPEGRVLLPKEWRELHGRSVVIIAADDYIRILPKEKKVKLSDLLDSVEVDLESDMSDWDAVERELFGGKWK